MKLKRLYETFNDLDGQLCVRVPLANTGQSAVLYAEDFFELVGLGVSWHWARNYIRPGGPGYLKVTVPGIGRRLVARLIARARCREQVRYRNGNRLDLRRSNLIIQKGCGRFDYAELLEGIASVEAA